MTSPVHPMKRFMRVRIEHLWASLPIALLVWFSLLRRVGLLDFWWHLKAGQIIVATGSIPRADLFSFTCPGRRFILQNWLVEVIYWGAYRVGGLAIVVTLNSAMLVAAFLPIYLLCREAARGPRTAAIVACMAVGALLTFSNVRSQVFSFACFSATYWVLFAYRARRRNALWVLPLLMIAWVNLHGGFVLGLGLMALFLGSEAVRRLVLGARPDTLSPSELAGLATALALSLVATLLNPEGYRAYSSVTAVTQDPVSQSFVTEWQPPRFDQVGVLGFYGPFFAALLVFLYATERLDLTELALFIGFAVFALTALRNAIWFVLVVTPIVARYVGTVDATSVLRRIPRLRGERRAAPPVRYGLNAVLALVLVAVTVALLPWFRVGGDVALVDDKTPVGAIDYMEAHALRGNVFAPEIYGDYLIWRLWPAQRSFVDSRVHLFNQCPAVVDDYNLVFFDSHWEERLARYQIRYMLLSKDEVESRSMIDGGRASTRWRVLYEDGSSILFESTREASA
jgi:hypothetical protein